MAARLSSRLEEFFTEHTDGELRSIIRYEPDDYEIVYLRDDVSEQYSQKELEESIDDSRMESLTRSIYEETFSTDHGSITCLVKCFQHAIEMNFVLDDGVGTAVGLDERAMAQAHGIVTDAWDIVVDERENHSPDDHAYRE